MFDKLICELKKMERMRVSIPIETDAEGFVDKECPSENCMFQFKVYADDWSQKFKDEAVYFQMCGHNATADSFLTKKVKASKDL